jgi:hypothetical protein
VLQDIVPVEFKLPSGQRVLLRIKDAFIASPCVPEGSDFVKTPHIYPAEVGYTVT